MNRDTLIAAYNRFDPNPDVDDAFLVPPLGVVTVNRILSFLEDGDRFRKILLTGQPGCGKSTVLRRIARDERLRHKRQVVAFSVMDELNVLDVTVHDLIWLIYTKLVDAMRRSGLEPLMDAFDPWIAPFARAFDMAETGADLLPIITRRIQTDVKCRRALRDRMISDAGAFGDLLDAACERFSRFTLEYYQMTDPVFDTLKEEDVSENILDKLQHLKGIEYPNEHRFVKDVQDAIGDIQAIHYQPLLLKHAWVESPKDAVIVMDDTDKLPPRSLSSVFSSGAAPLSRVNSDILMTFPTYGVFLGGFNEMASAFRRMDLPVRHPEEKTEETGATTAGVLTDLIRKRLGDGIVFPEEVTDLFIRKSGGVPGDLLSMVQDFLKLAIERPNDETGMSMAETVIGGAEADMLRAFSMETRRSALTEVMSSRSIDRLGDAEKIYLLRRNHVLRYEADDGGEWYEIHPLLRQAAAGGQVT